MFREGMDAKDVTPEQIRQVAADVQLFIERTDYTGKSVATANGYSASVISQFLKGTYDGDNATLALQLDSWLIEAEQKASRPRPTQFVWTNVARAIEGTASYCLDEGTIGLIYGPDTSGLGKTTALEAV